MNFIPMSELLDRAASGGYAVPAFCVWNAETVEVVLRTAEALKAPVIVMSGPAEFGLLRPAQMGAIAHTVAKQFNVPAALHLDHGDSLELVEACLNAGYTSVMLDYSRQSFQENAEAMRRVATMAHPLGVTVEGELGTIGQVDRATQEGGKQPTLTDPEVAARFVKETGIDTLAVAIGNAHGIYTTLPQLDFDRLNGSIRPSLCRWSCTGVPAPPLRICAGPSRLGNRQGECGKRTRRRHPQIASRAMGSR